MYVGQQNPYAGVAKFDSKDLPGAVARVLETLQGRADANETALFARQLEYIYQGSYDIEYRELKARQLIPVDTRVPSGADSFTYRQFDKLGEAIEVHNYSQDFPNVSVVGKEFKQPIVSLGASYQYTIQDMRAAAMAGLPLEAKMAEAARWAMEVKLEQMAVKGSSRLGAGQMYGLANAPNIQAVTKVSKNSAGTTATTWAGLLADALSKGNTTAAAQEIAKDIMAMSRAIMVNTDMVHVGDTLVLPSDCWSILATTPRAPGFTDDNLLEYIKKTTPGLKTIEVWPMLNNAGASVNSVVGRVMMYQKEARVLSLIISQDFEQFAPQPRNMSFIVPCHMRTGAVEVRYPLAVAYMDGCGGSAG